MEAEKKIVGNTDTTEKWSEDKCIFCKNDLKGSIPKLAPCFHSLCSNCINEKTEKSIDIAEGNEVKDAIKCPICFQEFFKSDVIDNYFMSKGDECTENIQDNDGINKTIPSCTSCEDNAPASSFCTDCEEWLCDACVQAHQRVRVTKDHVIRAKDDVDSDSTSNLHNRQNIMFCPIHKQESLKLFCETCDVLTCRDCQLASHRDHKYKFATEASLQERQQLQILITTLLNKKQHLDSVLGESVGLFKYLSEREEKLRFGIKEFATRFISEIGNRARQLIKDLNQIYLEKRCELALMARDIEIQKMKTDHGIKFAESALKSENDFALLYSKKVLLNQLKLMSETRVLTPPPRSSVEVNFVYETNHIVHNIKTLGSLIVGGVNSQFPNSQQLKQMANQQASNQDSRHIQQPKVQHQTGPRCYNQINQGNNLATNQLPNPQLQQFQYRSSSQMNPRRSQHEPNVRTDQYSPVSTRAHVPMHTQPPMSSHTQPTMPSHTQPPMPSHTQPPMPSHTQPQMPSHTHQLRPPHAQIPMPPHNMQMQKPPPYYQPQVTSTSQDPSRRANPHLFSLLDKPMNEPWIPNISVSNVRHQTPLNEASSHQPNYPININRGVSSGGTFIPPLSVNSSTLNDGRQTLIQQSQTLHQKNAPYTQKSMQGANYSFQPPPIRPPPSNYNRYSNSSYGPPPLVQGPALTSSGTQKLSHFPATPNLNSNSTSVTSTRNVESLPVMRPEITIMPVPVPQLSPNVQASHISMDSRLASPQSSSSPSTSSLTPSTSPFIQDIFNWSQTNLPNPVTQIKQEKVSSTELNPCLESGFPMVKIKQEKIDDELQSVCADAVENLLATINASSTDTTAICADSSCSPSALTQSISNPSQSTSNPSLGIASNQDTLRIVETRTLAQEDPNDDWCSVCHDGGDVLCCGQCPRVYHLQCHIPELSRVPREEEHWQCRMCMKFNDLNASFDLNDTGMSEKNLKLCQKLLLELMCHESSPSFHHPVRDDIAPGYSQIIKTPMEMITIKRKLNPAHVNHYSSILEFYNDLNLIFSNCFAYNAEDTEIYKIGKIVKGFMTELMCKYFPELEEERPRKKQRLDEQELVHVT